MSDQNTQPSFRIVRRGYEPTDVNRHIAELLKETGQHQQRIAELTGKVRELEAARQLAQEQSEQPPTFADFGKRIGDILALAEEEAGDIRARAESDVATIRREAQAEAERIRSEADQYADVRRAEADEDAETIVAAAHKRADELAEETQREAAARRQEADALFESQQAAAAQAAADFETTVWVNDVEVGSHRGGHTSFTFDITDGLDDPSSEVELTMRVIDEFRADQVRGKQTTTFPYLVHYRPTSGIWLPVWIEVAGARWIRELHVTATAVIVVAVLAHLWSTVLQVRSDAMLADDRDRMEQARARMHPAHEATVARIAAHHATMRALLGENAAP